MVNEEVILAEGKEYDEMLDCFDNPSLTSSERMAAEQRFEEWKRRNASKHEDIDRFMSTKIGTIRSIIEASDKLVSRNGHVSQKKEQPKSDETISKEEYNELKEGYNTMMKEFEGLKKFLQEKLS